MTTERHLDGPISEEAARKYLEDGGRCPYCGSDDTDVTDSSQEGPRVTQEVECWDCARGWEATLLLQSIRAYTEPPEDVGTEGDEEDEGEGRWFPELDD